MSTLIIDHHPVSPPGRCLEILRTYGHKVRLVRTHAGDTVPTDLDGIDAIVSCGGEQSACEPDAAMEAECALLAAAHAASVPVLGLCLGAQLLARALGGEVAKLADGPEVGFLEVALTPAGREDPLWKGIPWWSHQYLSHEDEVRTAPPGARILASSRRTPIQAFAVGSFTYGVQYHPEFTRDIVTGHWTKPGRFTDAGGGTEELMRQVDVHQEAFDRHAERFFESVALFLMPLDRLHAGVTREVEH